MNSDTWIESLNQIMIFKMNMVIFSRGGEVWFEFIHFRLFEWPWVIKWIWGVETLTRGRGGCRGARKNSGWRQIE